MFNGDCWYGTDQVHPTMGENNELFDYSEEGYDNMNKNINKYNNDDDKFISGSSKQTKEHLTSEEPIPVIPVVSHQPQYIPTTNQLLQSMYSKLSANINYLFVIFILIIVCIAQKNTIDQMKFLLMVSMNKNTSEVKLPIT